MATTTWRLGQTASPDPEYAALCLGLAAALLQDRQYKLGTEMLGHAMFALEPYDLHASLRRMYEDVNQGIWDAFRLGQWETAAPIKSRNTMTLRVTP